MLSKSALENMSRVYYAANDMFREAGEDGYANSLCDDFGHELSAWSAWYDDGMDSDYMPDYKPTMADLNYYLAKLGYKGIGGKNPRIVKL